MPRRHKTMKTFEAGHGFTKEDWDAVSDSPELTAEEMARAKPFPEAHPEIFARMEEEDRRGRGRPPSDEPKVSVSLRLDREVVEKLRASGRGWQTRVNEILKKAV